MMFQGPLAALSRETSCFIISGLAELFVCRPKKAGPTRSIMCFRGFSKLFNPLSVALEVLIVLLIPADVCFALSDINTTNRMHFGESSAYCATILLSRAVHVDKILVKCDASL
jgi:hypothetical protein